MPTAAVNGIQINYADSGGDGQTVVLSHGFLMDHSMFDAQVAALAPELLSHVRKTTKVCRAAVTLTPLQMSAGAHPVP